LAGDRARLNQMRLDARSYALGCSWDAVFDQVYAAYGTVLPNANAG
jgi:phosphatidylinositol alpha 1,6-mannosyltransferase